MKHTAQKSCQNTEGFWGTHARTDALKPPRFERGTTRCAAAAPIVMKIDEPYLINKRTPLTVKSREYLTPMASSSPRYFQGRLPLPCSVFIREEAFPAHAVPSLLWCTHIVVYRKTATNRPTPVNSHGRYTLTRKRAQPSLPRLESN